MAISINTEKSLASLIVLRLVKSLRVDMKDKKSGCVLSEVIPPVGLFSKQATRKADSFRYRPFANPSNHEEFDKANRGRHGPTDSSCYFTGCKKLSLEAPFFGALFICAK
jgi:hypothetical protein